MNAAAASMVKMIQNSIGFSSSNKTYFLAWRKKNILMVGETGFVENHPF